MNLKINDLVEESVPLLPGETYVQQGINLSRNEAVQAAKVVSICLIGMITAIIVWNLIYIRPHDQYLKTYGAAPSKSLVNK